MRKFLPIFFIIYIFTNIATCAYGDTLYDLYSDNSSINQKQTPAAEQTKHKHHKKNTSQKNQNKYTAGSTSNYSRNSGTNPVFNAVNNNKDAIVQKASQNYNGQGYSSNNKRINPVLIDNPYDNLNIHCKNSTNNSNLNGVTFKKDFWGNINAYDSQGNKLGKYNIGK